MKFSKVIGEIVSEEAENLIQNCEKYLSEVLAELSAGWDVKILGTEMGGDPLLMQLVSPMPHYCDLTGYNFLPLKKKLAKIERKNNLNIQLTEEDLETLIKVKEYKTKYRNIIETAATDGKRFYWAPQFVLSKSKIGVRLLINHEGYHAALLHPSRIGHRIPSLWNISIDFKSNYNSIADLRARGFKNAEKVFLELGDFVNLEDYAAFIRDPYNPPEKMIPFSPRFELEQMLSKNYIENDYESPVVLYAEPNLNEKLRQPEDIYDFLQKQVPRCQECGRQFCYRVPEDVLEMKRKLKKIQETNGKK